MNILYLLIPLSLILLSLAVWAFFWAVRNDQFDDLEGPAYRILFEDEDPPT
ncbi:MAG: cbb3-type cytochrome oxidase assembly protein CcoS, partial [Pseudomonadota bacterium]|nr:cbb3-type cytochrome oxidase assembly protein CcoS [Pseudomonadota bacterium]